MTRPAVFLDRDGCLSEEVGYVNHVSRIRAIPGVAGAIARLNRAGVPAVMVTNQAGAARGYFPLDLIEQVNAALVAQLAGQGARIDGVYYCPHLRGAVLPELDVDCGCRKPRTGLIERAAADLNLDPKRSFMVGDKYSDVELGFAMGGEGLLVLTGYGRGEVEWFSSGWKRPPDLVAENLDEVVDHVFERLGIDG
ncbi:HAD family hydrolase [bacterium]|nr:HAD family hydrolase [bacterium]